MTPGDLVELYAPFTWALALDSTHAQKPLREFHAEFSPQRGRRSARISGPFVLLDWSLDLTKNTEVLVKVLHPGHGVCLIPIHTALDGYDPGLERFMHLC